MKPNASSGERKTDKRQRALFFCEGRPRPSRIGQPETSRMEGPLRKVWQPHTQRRPHSLLLFQLSLLLINNGRTRSQTRSTSGAGVKAARQQREFLESKSRVNCEKRGE
ncbi:hypothetical protein M9H77_09217 [Catharanthus roseus]|uniref:Uncharacterized protein n=1 Tax=Catharanthus roseus TaxID=4058 RepID=A0ACC0C0A9_CATRO|nr:hypothetical protein M9H77_09217 [Catharanthus roseus]